MQVKTVVSARPLVEKLFQFVSAPDPSHLRFFEEMMAGMIGSSSTLLSNIARFLNPQKRIKHTVKRLSRMLNNELIPLEELKIRMLELGSFRIQNDAIIAFDPGDLCKKYARKMDSLYKVWDGSEGKANQGYELFSAEAVQFKDGVRHQIPLYEKITSAKHEKYVSQNHQIIQAVQLVHSYLGAKGIWAFDRTHDRSVLYKNLFLKLPHFRWIIRLKENRSVIPVDEKYEKIQPRKKFPGLMDLANCIPLEKRTIQIREPQTTAPLRVGYTKLKLEDDPSQTILTLIVVHDYRNEKPVYLLTNLEIKSTEDATVAFGSYLLRWSIEDSYRLRKSVLKLEQIRVLNFRAIEMLHFLVYLNYFYICIFDWSGGSRELNSFDKGVPHFKPLKKLKYRYYRVIEFMRIRLYEQRGLPYPALIYTHFG